MESSDNVDPNHDRPSDVNPPLPSIPTGLTSGSSDTGESLAHLSASVPASFAMLYFANGQQVDSDPSDNDSALGDPSV